MGRLAERAFSFLAANATATSACSRGDHASQVASAHAPSAAPTWIGKLVRQSAQWAFAPAPPTLIRRACLPVIGRVSPQPGQRTLAWASVRE